MPYQRRNGEKGTSIQMMATGAKAEVVEVGYFGAGQFIPCEELSAGMVGYITASLKNVKDTRVGDTVTDANRPCKEPLPGYKKVQPMVYCGLYPADGAKYQDLRDALENYSSMTPHFSLSRRHRLHLDLVSDVVFRIVAFGNYSGAFGERVQSGSCDNRSGRYLQSL